MTRYAYVCGTLDTKYQEIKYLYDILIASGVPARLVDLSTTAAGAHLNPDTVESVSNTAVAAHHPQGALAVFTGDRGASVTAMSLAFENYIKAQHDVAGVISAGGSGATALVSPAMRALPVGVPKVLLSTVASGDVRPYVGASDICMMYSVADIQGLNRISKIVLENAANALAGMIAFAQPAQVTTRQAVGLSMFGVTTPCVQQVAAAIEKDYDCLVFHATGAGGQSLEKLALSGHLKAVIDITTTEIADEIVGGVFTAGPSRLDAIIQSKTPYIGSVGALDMVNFHARSTVPEKFSDRNLYQHNAQVTLMRTNTRENILFAEFLAAKLNQMQGPCHFLLPLRGVSALDAPGGVFEDPEANEALFSTLRQRFVSAPSRRLIEIDCHINDPLFAAAALASFAQLFKS